MLSLTLGDRRLLSPELKEELIESGTYHFLAISGLHLGILLVWLGRLGLPRQVQLFAVAVFCALTGAAPPVARATSGAALVWLAERCNRSIRSIDTVCWTAFFLLLTRPDWLASVGFQLSVSAVLGIVCWSSPLGSLLAGRQAGAAAGSFPAGSPKPDGAVRRALSAIAKAAGRTRRVVAPPLAVSLAAFVGTAPAAVYHFQELHPLGVLWSLLVYPIVVTILFCALVSVGIAPIVPAIAAPFVEVAHGGTTLLQALAPRLADLPGASVPIGAPPLAAGVLFVAGMIILGPVRCAGSRRASGSRGRLGLGCIACGLLLQWGIAAALQGGRAEVWMLEVGAGSCHLVRVGDATILVDAGSRNRPRVCGRAISGALATLRVARLSALVLTHGDADHINGVEHLLRRFHVGRVWVPPSFQDSEAGRELLAELRRRRVPVEQASRGYSLRARTRDGPPWRLEVLAPRRTPWPKLRDDRNESSLVLRLVVGDDAVLLPGDVEELGTAALLGGPDDLRAGVVALPHHGRRNTLCEALLRASRPSSVIVSARRGEEDLELLARLERQGIEVLRTGTHGAIHVRWNPRTGWAARAPYAAPR